MASNKQKSFAAAVRFEYAYLDSEQEPVHRKSKQEVQEFEGVRGNAGGPKGVLHFCPHGEQRQDDPKQQDSGQFGPPLRHGRTRALSIPRIGQHQHGQHRVIKWPDKQRGVVVISGHGKGERRAAMRRLNVARQASKWPSRTQQPLLQLNEASLRQYRFCERSYQLTTCKKATAMTSVRILFSFLFVLTAVRGSAQRLDTIKYTVPDIVKTAISNYMGQFPKDQQAFVVLDYASDTTSLLISRYRPSSPMEPSLLFLLRNSNRCIDVTPACRLVVVLPADLRLSEAALHVVNKGQRNEGLHTTDFGLSGQIIRYTSRNYWNARIVQSTYFQH